MKTHAQNEKDRYIAASSECERERASDSGSEKGRAWKEEEAKMRAEICATFAQKTF